MTIFSLDVLVPIWNQSVVPFTSNKANIKYMIIHLEALSCVIDKKKPGPSNVVCRADYKFCGICITRRRQWHPTPVLLPGKSHGQGSLVGCKFDHICHD